MGMKEDTVYLCGPMEGMTKSEMSGWRSEAAHQLSSYGIKTLDPCRRGKFHSGKMTTNLANRVFKSDLKDISESQVILANLSNREARAWGSVAEIAHGHTKHKIIIVVVHPDDPPHPFIVAYATEIHTDLREAVDAVRTYFA